MEAEDSLLAVKSEPTESGTGKSQAELDNDLFAKMKATERKRKPPPVTKKEEEEEEPCKDTFDIRFYFHFDSFQKCYFDRNSEK